MDLRGEEPKEQVFKYDGGIRSFVESINKAKTPIHDGVIYIKKELPKVSVEVAFQYDGWIFRQHNVFCKLCRTQLMETHYPDSGLH